VQTGTERSMKFLIACSKNPCTAVWIVTLQDTTLLPREAHFQCNWTLYALWPRYH